MQAMYNVKFSSSCIKKASKFFFNNVLLTWNIQNIVILTCNHYSIIIEVFYIVFEIWCVFHTPTECFDLNTKFLLKILDLYLELIKFTVEKAVSHT